MGISEALFQMLLAYYSCDYMATQRMLSYDEVQGCAAVYEIVKTEVSGLDSTDPKTTTEAYLAWKAWEKENSTLVDAIRNQAIDGIEK